jgi:hypothetical protein
MRYKIYFRETVFRRCHINVDDCTDGTAAIASARLAYGQGDANKRRDIELDGVKETNEVNRR